MQINTLVLHKRIWFKHKRLMFKINHPLAHRLLFIGLFFSLLAFSGWTYAAAGRLLNSGVPAASSSAPQALPVSLYSFNGEIVEAESGRLRLRAALAVTAGQESRLVYQDRTLLLDPQTPIRLVTAEGGHSAASASELVLGAKIAVYATQDPDVAQTIKPQAIEIIPN